MQPHNAGPQNNWLNRRSFLDHAGTGLGFIALAWLLQRESLFAAPALSGLHFPAKAKRIIHIFSPGGVSQVDTFDYKPELEKLDGTKLTSKGELDTFFASPGLLRKSVFPFKQHGKSGAWVSELFPHLSTCVDDMAFIHSMVAKSPSHSPACFQMNTGFTLAGFPSMGGWISYGLGNLSDNLPSFVVLPDPRGLVNGGTANWSNGFLPAQHQGTMMNGSSNNPIANLHSPDNVSSSARIAGLKLIQSANSSYADADPFDSSLAARLKSYELAGKMQTSIPEAVNFQNEPEHIRKLYGIDDPVIGASARNFLLARRLSERGVRFVQLYNGGALGSPRINWDGHEDVKDNHQKQGLLLDQPCAALLKDLKQRGMLEDTLVVWSTEFGRTPFTQGNRGPQSLGRDHHQHTFTCWLAGAGVKAGSKYGASDEIGYKVANDPVSIYDFHATILHLMGINHEKLSYYHNGIARRLTDVHGHVVKGLLA